MTDKQVSTTNTYSHDWFELFLSDSDMRSAQTAKEAAFIQRTLPHPETASILDLCCGLGRHAVFLAEAGYKVLGVDRDPHVIAQAKSLHTHPNLAFLAHDMTELASLTEKFDAVICMWQSFGYFDSGTNLAVMVEIAEHVRPGGRVVLDIYNRSFFDQRQGTRATHQRGETIITSQALEGDLLVVKLEYTERGREDTFAWQLYTPETISHLAQSGGLTTTLVCSGFDEREEPTSDKPRMQVVLEKR